MISNGAAIAAGSLFSLAVTSNGQVYAWGDNSDGQLGTNVNDVVNSVTPLLVAGISNAVSVSASLEGDGGGEFGNIFADDGGEQVLAVTVDQGTNHYWGWGDNNEGEVGNGISGYTTRDLTTGVTTNQYTPAQLQFCTRCQRSVQLGTAGSFTAQCNGTLYLYFNDEIGAFGDNAGSFTVTVNGVTTNVLALDASGYGIGIAVGTITNGGVYPYSASGFCVRDNQGHQSDANGNDTNGIPVSCSSISITNSICPVAKCFSLVGKIQ